LQRAYNKYGPDCLEFSVVELVENIELIPREQYWINYFNAINNAFGYNTQPIAGKTTPWIYRKHHTPETIEKIRQSNLGQKRSGETRRNIGLTSLGRKVSEATKEKRRVTLKARGYRHSEETKEKIRQTKIGDKNPSKKPEARKKLSESHMGYIMPEEQKRKIGLAISNYQRKKHAGLL
jgi:group I intron endonuclease